MLDIDDARSYTDETRLWRALENFKLHQARPIIVCNRLGRFTAVFGAAHLTSRDIPIIAAAQAGFPVIN